MLSLVQVYRDAGFFIVSSMRDTDELSQFPNVVSVFVFIDQYVEEVDEFLYSIISIGKYIRRAVIFALDKNQERIPLTLKSRKLIKEDCFLSNHRVFQQAMGFIACYAQGPCFLKKGDCDFSKCKEDSSDSRGEVFSIRLGPNAGGVGGAVEHDDKTGHLPFPEKPREPQENDEDAKW